MKGNWGEDGDMLAWSLQIQGGGEGRPGGPRTGIKQRGESCYVVFLLGCVLFLFFWMLHNTFCLCS